jgi:UDP-glucuronate decarboxylase
MRMLVTGGAGFIGSNLCESLVSDGRRVVCLDNLGSGRRANVAPMRDDDGFLFVDADVRDPLPEMLRDCGVDPADVGEIYHLASRASPPDFESHPFEIALTNSLGTRNVLELAREVDARVLYTSTSEVYGNPEVSPQSETYHGNVNCRGERACYDESKRFGETLATLFAREEGVDVRTARIFNTYGPRMRPDDGRVIPNFLTQALRGDDLTVYGDGTQTRSFLYVDDQIRGLRKLMATSGLGGEVVNIGGTDEITIETLADIVISLTEDSVGRRYESLPYDDDPERRRPDISRAREALDWEPEVDLKDGLRQTLADFRVELA